MFLETLYTDSNYIFIQNSDYAPVSSKEFLDIQATIECGFTPKHVRDMIKTYRHYILFIIWLLKTKVIRY